MQGNGKGGGSKILNCFIDFCKNKHINKIWLSDASKNLNRSSKNFYFKFGFKPTGKNN
jgi:hypothetical protein